MVKSINRIEKEVYVSLSSPIIQKRSQVVLQNLLNLVSRAFLDESKAIWIEIIHIIRLKSIINEELQWLSVGDHKVFLELLAFLSSLIRETEVNFINTFLKDISN